MPEAGTDLVEAYTSRKRTRSQKIALIKQDVEEGVPSIEHIENIEGLSKSTLYWYASKGEVVLPTTKN